MNHIDESTLRRSLDEPFALSEAARLHIDGCPRCRSRLDVVRRDRDAVAAVMSAPVPSPSASAFGRLQPALASKATRSGPMAALRDLFAPRQPGRSRWRPKAMVAAVGVLLVGAGALTPAGGVAHDFLTIFQPSTIQPISVTSGELRALPDLRNYGSLQLPADVSARTLHSAAAASRASGLHVAVPGYLPGSVPRTVIYQEIPGKQSTFTFSQAKARATAHRLHQTLPAMPAGLDRSTVMLTTEPAVVAFYGRRHNLPDLVVGETPRPRLSSTGPSFTTIEDYLVRLPGVSKSLAAQIKAIGDPTQTLPIPVPVDLAYAHKIQINGHAGILIGDNTGILSVVIWQENGVIHGVAGQLTSDQVMQVAASLH